MNTRDGQPADRKSPYADITLEKDSALIRIAFLEFLEGWYDEFEMYESIENKEEKVQNLWNKFNDQWLPSLQQAHCGDCTRVPCACTRCWTELFLDNAKYILSLEPKPYVDNYDYSKGLK